jgi:predicted transcriptional regulator
MAIPKLTRLELQIMEALWTRGQCSVREIQESFSPKKRPAYTTVQTTVYRLELKKALRRVKKIATALIFEAAVSREVANAGSSTTCWVCWAAAAGRSWSTSSNSVILRSMTFAQWKKPCLHANRKTRTHGRNLVDYSGNIRDRRSGSMIQPAKEPAPLRAARSGNGLS